MRVDRLAIVIGASKCATTTLFGHLAQHPELSPCSDKEPQFFSRPELLAQGAAHYDAMFEFDPARHRYGLEATTHYSWDGVRDHTTGVPERMKAFGREFRFIYVVREPIARIESHLNFALRMYTIDGWSERGETVPTWLVRMTDYFAQLAAYRQHFAAEQILVINFHDYAARPASTLARIEDFLELPHHEYASLSSAHNVTAEMSSPPRLWYSLRAFKPLRALVRALPSAVRSQVRRSVSRERENGFRLNTAQREYVHRELAESMRALGRDYGIDVAAWGY